MDKNKFNDVAKEFLVILSYCDSSFIEKIPSWFLQRMNFLAADSLKDFYIDKNKSLNEQNMSEECKDLLSLVYYMYVVVPEEKKPVVDAWLKNQNSNGGGDNNGKNL